MPAEQARGKESHFGIPDSILGVDKDTLSAPTFYFVIESLIETQKTFV